MTLRHWLWEKVQIYFPLIILGTLALVTYWMARQNETMHAQTLATHGLHDTQPDYMIDHLSLRRFNAQGDLSMHVIGASAAHVPTTKELRIEQIKFNSTEDKSNKIFASADTGFVNDEQTLIQLRGDAYVSQTSATKKASAVKIQYWGNSLNYYPKTEQLTSSEPVSIQKGNDTFTADQLQLDNRGQTLEMKGRVRVTIPPTSTSAAANRS